MIQEKINQVNGYIEKAKNISKYVKLVSSYLGSISNWFSSFPTIPQFGDSNPEKQPKTDTKPMGEV